MDRMASSPPPLNEHEAEVLREKQFEDEIMGETNKQASANFQKSVAMEKNLNQMVKVLKSRLKGLESAANTRIKLCSEDLDATSFKMSKQAPKIVDEFDEVIPKSLRDTRASSMNNNNTTNNVPAGINNATHGKENLVSSDTIFIDPYHLVVRTKSQTETAKKLEVAIEESFGNANLREMKNKKNKALNQSEKSKRTEQLKNEAKRINRIKIEKKLQMNMENFVTRSVMDPELVFHMPSSINKEADWPVSVKWCSRDPRSLLAENHEGEFDPDLLLRYSLEKMNLPSGKKLFTWLMKQPMIQRYFVSVFWIIKVKFFESDSSQQKDVEAYLLRLLSLEYRCMIELLGNRTHAEHEKDFVFKYLPFIFTNGVYFGFYYVFPGSRHIYTKGFKKTIYMQVIQVMHGFQVCPISVRVAWGKVFPEDVHEDSSNAASSLAAASSSNPDEVIEDGGEVFPVQLAFKSQPPIPFPTTGSRRRTSGNTTNTGNTGTNTNSRPSSSTGKGGGGIAMLGSPTTHFTGSTNSLPSLGVGNGTGMSTGMGGKSGMMAMDSEGITGITGMGGGITGMGGGITGMSGVVAGGNSTFPGMIPLPPAASSSYSSSAGSVGSGNLSETTGMGGGNGNTGNHVSGNTGMHGTGMHGNGNTGNGHTGIPHHHHHPSTTGGSTTHSTTTHSRTIQSDGHGGMSGDDDNHSFFPGATAMGYSKAQQRVDTHTYATDLRTLQPLTKTYLTPLLEKPQKLRGAGANGLMKRQSNVERVNTNALSPQMTLFLSAMNSSIQSDVIQEKQTFRRTIPVSWAPAGGTDTHRKRNIATELHASIANARKVSQQTYFQETYASHHTQIRTVQENAKTLDKVLNSGPTNISRYALDLIRRQRNLRPGGGPAANANNTNNGHHNTGSQQDTTPPQPMEEIDWNEMQQLAQYDDDEIDRFLADF